MRVFFCIICLFPAIANSEVVLHLKDGGRMVGISYQAKGARIILKTQLGTIGIYKERVAKIEEDVVINSPYPGKAGFGNKPKADEEAKEEKKQNPLLQRYSRLKNRVDLSHGARTEELKQLIADLREFRNHLMASNVTKYINELRQTNRMEKQVNLILSTRR